MRIRLSPAHAVAAYYFLFFGALGFFWPNYPVFLRGLGLSSGEATAVMAIGPIAGLVMPPLVGLAADALRARVWFLRLLSAGAPVAFAFWMLEPRAGLVIAAIAVGYGVCRAPLSSLSDASALEAARAGGHSYGGLRLWGSVGFCLFAFVGGAVIEHLGGRAMIAATVAGLAVAAAFVWLLPAPRPSRRPRVFAEWAHMLRAPELWLLLFAVGVAQVGNSAYDVGFSQELARRGHGGTYIGLAWAVGVFAEVVCMWRAAPLTDRFGAPRILAAAIAAGALRWFLLAYTHGGAAVMALQPMHGVTYGLFYVGAVQCVAARASADTPAAAQGLLGAALAVGAVGGMLGAGWLFGRHGGHVMFLCVAATGALAAVAATVYVFASGAQGLKIAARAGDVDLPP